MIEISCVPVGSNRDALSKSKQRKRDFVERKRTERGGVTSYADMINYRRGAVTDWSGRVLSQDEIDRKAAEYAEAILGEFPERLDDYTRACRRAIDLLFKSGEKNCKFATLLLRKVGYAVEGGDDERNNCVSKGGEGKEHIAVGVGCENGFTGYFT